MSIEIKEGKHKGESGVVVEGMPDGRLKTLTLEGDIHYYDKDGKEYTAEGSKAKCTECNWEGPQGDCGFGHNDFYCPNCGKESIEVAEPKALGGKG